MKIRLVVVKKIKGQILTNVILAKFVLRIPEFANKSRHVLIVCLHKINFKGVFLFFFSLVNAEGLNPGQILDTRQYTYMGRLTLDTPGKKTILEPESMFECSAEVTSKKDKWECISDQQVICIVAMQ